MYYLLYALPIFTNSEQISILDSNTECMQIEFEFKFLNQKMKRHRPNPVMDGPGSKPVTELLRSLLCGQTSI